MRSFWIRFGLLVPLAFALEAGLPLSSSQAISLSEARKEALQAYLGVKVAREEVVAARSERKARKADFFPKLDLDANLSYRGEAAEIKIDSGAFGQIGQSPLPANDVSITFLERDRYELDLTLYQTIFSGGKIYFGFQKAWALERATEWEEQQTIEDVLSSVEQAYFNLLQALEAEEVAQQKLTDLKAHLSDVQKLHAAGRIALTDVLKVQVEVARADEEVLKAVNEREIAVANLNRFLGRSKESTIEVEPVLDPPPLRLDLKEAQQIALDRRPALLQIREQLGAAIVSRRIVQGDYYPRLDLTGRYTFQSGQETLDREQWEILGAVNWTFWEWGRTHQEVAEARAIERRTAYKAELLADEIHQAVREAWLRIRESDQRIKVAEEARIHAEENLRVTRLGFQAGTHTSTELLDAETLLAETRFERTQTRYDAWIARAALRFAMGVIREESLPERDAFSSNPSN